MSLPVQLNQCIGNQVLKKRSEEMNKHRGNIEEQLWLLSYKTCSVTLCLGVVSLLTLRNASMNLNVFKDPRLTT